MGWLRWLECFGFWTSDAHTKGPKVPEQYLKPQVGASVPIEISISFTLLHIVQASVYSILSHLTLLQGLYPSSERIDLKKLRKLIIDGRLVACYPGLEEGNSASCDEVSNVPGVRHDVMLQTVPPF